MIYDIKPADLADNNWMTPWEQEVAIKAMLRYGILKWSNARDLPLKSGGTTDIYVNMRQARNHPEAMDFFARMFSNPLGRLDVDRFAEVPQAVTCFSGQIAKQISKPLVTIRETAKGGRVSDANIIGDIRHGDLIGLYDDVITDGASKLPGYRTILSRGGKPILVVAVDRQQGWQNTFAKAGINMPMWAGMTLHDIRTFLIKKGLMERCDAEAEKNNPIIIALDGKSWEEILPVADQLRTTGTILKVNDLAMGEGVANVVPKLQVYGRVMVDLKAHDIPATVSNISKRVAVHNPWAFTFHASGGPEVAEVVQTAFKGTGTILLAITVLTSIDEKTGEEIYTRRPLEQVKALAKMMWDAGIRGFVCSPKEAPTLREMFPKATIVTPGVRSKGTAKGDQKRVTTPVEAMEGGADYIVGGRQFFGAPDPVAEVNRVLTEELWSE